ncbi:hypothetical protein D3C81_2065880 [compost metagenome]
MVSVEKMNRYASSERVVGIRNTARFVISASVANEPETTNRNGRIAAIPITPNIK